MTVTDHPAGTPSEGPTTHEGVPLSSAVFAPGSDAIADDDGGSGIDFFAGLKLVLGDLTDRVSDLGAELQAWRKMQNEYPGWIDLNTVLTYNNANPNAIVQSGGTGVGVIVGGPDLGRCWSVRNIIVGPAQIGATAPTGSAYFLSCAQLPQDLSLTNAIDFAPSLPSVAFYSPREFFVGPNENLYMVVVGGVAGQQIVASCAIQDEPYRPMGTEINA